jgi:hypothetical protein
VRLVDRTKDLVKSGGEWISSVELENAIMGHPKVAEAAVIGIPDEKWSERPLACVVPEGEEEISLDELREYLAERVPKWWIPNDLEIIGSSRRSRRRRSGSSPRRRCASSSPSARRPPHSNRADRIWCRSMRRALVTLGVAFAVLCGAAPGARAAVTVTRDAGNLLLIGNGDDTVTLTELDATTIRVASPQGVEGDCGTAAQVDCAVDPNGTPDVQLGGGADTLQAATLKRAVVVMLDDGGDTVTTGSGDDAITVVGMNNLVAAGEGRDILTGAGALRGEGGDDLLTGGGTLDGGPGDDRLVAIEGTLAGGSGVDSVEFSLPGPVRISLDGVANDGGLLPANVLADVEILRGGAQNDVLRGAGGRQVLEGGGGADILDGGAGDDVLSGGEGADTLTGGAGRDQLQGEQGDDRLDGRDAEWDVADCGAGDDAVSADLIDTISDDCERRDVPVPPVLIVDDDPATPLPEPLAPVFAVAAAAAADARAPDVALALSRRVHRGLAVGVTCSETCALTLVLRVNARTARRLRVPRTLARATSKAAGRVTLKPRASVRRRLGRASVRATLTVTATDAAGNARTVTRSLSLRA